MEVRIIFTISKQMLHAVRCRDFRGSIQMRITQCRLKGRVTEIHLNFLQGIALMQQQRCTGVPLRYNYDKPEKPRRIKGFEVFSLVFSSFSKPKNHTEISRIIGGVSLTTNE